MLTFPPDGQFLVIVGWVIGFIGAITIVIIFIIFGRIYLTGFIIIDFIAILFTLFIMNSVMDAIFIPLALISA